MHKRIYGWLLAICTNSIVHHFRVDVKSNFLEKVLLMCPHLMGSTFLIRVGVVPQEIKVPTMLKR